MKFAPRRSIRIIGEAFLSKLVIMSLMRFFQYLIVLIAMYNVWNFVSKYILLLDCLRLESSKGLMASSLGRLLLVPAFYFTAKYGDQGWIIALISILGLMHDYLTICVMEIAPRGYKWPEQITPGNLLVMCVVGGISSSVLLDENKLMIRRDFAF